MLRRIGKGKCKCFGGRCSRGVWPNEGMGMCKAQSIAARRIDRTVLPV